MSLQNKEVSFICISIVVESNDHPAVYAVAKYKISVSLASSLKGVIHPANRPNTIGKKSDVFLMPGNWVIWGCIRLK